MLLSPWSSVIGPYRLLHTRCPISTSVPFQGPQLSMPCLTGDASDWGKGRSGRGRLTGHSSRGEAVSCPGRALGPWLLIDCRNREFPYLAPHEDCAASLSSCHPVSGNQPSSHWVLGRNEVKPPVTVPLRWVGPLFIQQTLSSCWNAGP